MSFYDGVNMTRAVAYENVTSVYLLDHLKVKAELIPSKKLVRN